MKKKPRMATTSVQMTQKQFNELEILKTKLKTTSAAQILRIAFDFFVKEKFSEI